VKLHIGCGRRVKNLAGELPTSKDRKEISVIVALHLHIISPDQIVSEQELYHLRKRDRGPSPSNHCQQCTG
jgi:hypothetical protein